MGSPGPRIALFLVLVLIGILLVLHFVFPGTLTTLVSPFWKIGNSLTPKNVLPESAESVRFERDTLKEENAELRLENNALRAQLQDIGIDGNEEGILSGILSRPPVSPYDVLVIDKGIEDGITLGAIVYAKSVPIGTVAVVTRESSRVLLFSSPGQESQGWVGENRLPITLVGAGSGVFEAHVPRESELLVGDTVYLPGPGALPIGTILRIDSHVSSPTAELRIRPLINVYTLTSVRVGSEILP